MTTTIPSRVNPKWLQQQQTKLECTAKLIDGQPNPNYEDMATLIRKCTAERQKWDAFEAWVKKTLGAMLNRYPLRTEGQSFEPGQVFFSKDKTTGKIATWTVAKAWEEYQKLQA